MKPLLFVLLSALPVRSGVNPYATIVVIVLPAGYHRVSEDPGSFADAVMRLRAEYLVPRDMLCSSPTRRKNPRDGLTPWYRADSSAGAVETPEYEFKTN